MVRPLAATALAVAALVSLDQIPTAEAAGKTYQKGHKVELWVSKVRQMISYEAQDVLVFLFSLWVGLGSFRRSVGFGTKSTDTNNGYPGKLDDPLEEDGADAVDMSCGLLIGSTMTWDEGWLWKQHAQ